MSTTFQSQPKYPDIQVTVNLASPDGNAFSILGCIQRELKRKGVAKEERDDFFAEATAGSYEDLLRVCGMWVTFRTI